MGLEPGWVTGVRGVSRNAQLRLLGNGVVPQQAELALRVLLGDVLVIPQAELALPLERPRKAIRARKREALYGGLYGELDAMLEALELVEA